MVINAHSLAKPDAAVTLNAELSANNIDICFVTETWLNDKIPSSLVCLGNYVFVRKDRCDSRSGGGQVEWLLCVEMTGKLKILILAIILSSGGK
jgi:hypothetical protein